MSRNSKASAGGLVTEASQDNAKINLQVNNNKPSPITQPGTALTAYLCRYKFDLLELPCDRHISKLVDCCDEILDEVRGCWHDKH